MLKSLKITYWLLIASIVALFVFEPAFAASVLHHSDTLLPFALVGMASSAISAQGSTLQVSTGTGAAKNITGLALGFPTIVTSAAHGFNNGDVVTFAALTGNTTLNGQTLTVRNVTVNTFAVNVDTTGGAAWVSGGTATPVQWTKIANVKTFSGFDGSSSELDVTNLDSVAKEFEIGLVDPGQFTAEVDEDDLDAGQLALLAAQSASALKTFKLTFPNGRTATFSGYVKKIGTQGAVDAVVKRAIDIRVSGVITRA